MNFGALPRSELEAMLRRLLLGVLMVAVSAGFTVPDESFAGMDCEQVPASDCGSEGMSASPCTLVCHAGPCIAPTFAQAEPAIELAPAFAPLSARHSDRARAPDTAPPKHSIA